MNKKELIRETNKGVGFLYDYIAEHYWEASKEELKEILLAVLGVVLDKCCGEEDEEAAGQLIVDELAGRGYGEDDVD